ncbi:hypothetical protein [Pleomorphomonas sp. NRK KF1]|uniref:hypothetical protein n=1 Tax=Pleomorphomonas sp. NRK KF1 TaxID=2943000 RepID=UPI0020448125|nr:hypothetical protein [Pleomorphomonas sp. NRK KF1]MCM5552392.1 hypothetical protein [Pleomorphomonas sp. NRK KF1]
MSHTGRPSYEIKLSQFRQILIWPLALALHPDGEDDVRHKQGISVADLVDRLDGKLAQQSDLWEQVLDLSDHAGKPGRTRRPPDRRREDTDEAYTNKLDKWRGAVDNLEKTADRAQAYGEFVYFYDFLQRTLFGDSEVAPFKLWRRKGIDGIRFKLRLNASGSRDVVYQADVRRLNLYTFSTGAAIVAVEVDFGQDPRVVSDELQVGVEKRRMTLEDALSINDHLRRVYTPFFAVHDNGEVVASRVPIEFEWLKRTDHGMEPVGFGCLACGEKIARTGAFTPDGLEATLEQTGLSSSDTSSRRANRAVPVFDYWRHALWPIVFEGGSATKDDLPVWRHVVDERVPLMSFVGITGAAHALGIGPSPAANYEVAQRYDLALISRGDWIRLCFADEAGNDPMPYNPRFLEDFEKKHCYDRFMASEATDSASRLLLASYHFAIVGSGRFFDETIVHHFRRHYFQMMLLANMEFASLLATSSRISVAVDSLSQADRQSTELSMKKKAERSAKAMVRFGHELQKIQHDFLRFVHRFRFVGVSNQIQPTEIFDQLRGVMKLESLYVDVKDELAAAVSFTHTVEQGQIAKSGMGLTAVATIAAAIGLALTFLSLGAISNPLQLIDWVAAGQAPAGQAPALSVMSALYRWLWALGPISIVTLLFLALTKAFVWAINRRLHEDTGERLIGGFLNYLMLGSGLFAFAFLICLGLHVHA